MDPYVASFHAPTFLGILNVSQMSRKKAKEAAQAKYLEQIPNVGPRIADDFRLIGINSPADLKRKDPLELYEQLNEQTGSRHDPCVLDTFMAAVDFMNGGEPKSWWAFTAERKELLAAKQKKGGK